MVCGNPHFFDCSEDLYGQCIEVQLIEFLRPEAKYEAGIREGLLRVAIGLEYADDLIDDLVQALSSIG